MIGCVQWNQVNDWKIPLSLDFKPDHSLHMPVLSPLSYRTPACSEYARDKLIEEV